MLGKDTRRLTLVLAVLIVGIMTLSTLAVANVAGRTAALPGGSGAPSAPVTTSAASSVGNAAGSSTPSPSVTPAVASPNPGTLNIYEYAPGGAFTLDPSVDYYTAGDEPNTNVYQTLIAFNGTQTGPYYYNYVPEVATCVPGSPTCAAMYGGSTLVYNNATTNQPQYYTFEISSATQFYDPATGASWHAYPSDVMFSLARTMSFSNLPFLGNYNGWINAQWALPVGNPGWDGGIHSPYNNTPLHVLSSMLINDSAYCPSPSAGAPASNGCITFDVGASGYAWPYFLELISDPLGASVTPCGTFTYLGAGLPGFLGTGSSAKGDGPCLLPGNATSTTQTAFQNYLSTVSPTAWDAVQLLAANGPDSPQPAVQWTEIGTGPYYQVSASNSGGPGGSGGYTLATNPTYVQPVGCAGQPACEPAPGQYIGNVSVIWQNGFTYGIEEAIAGQADSFAYDPTSTSTVLNLVDSGTYGLLRNVTDSAANWFAAFQLGVSPSSEHLIDPTSNYNVPGTFLASLSLRQFLTHAYPYTTIQNHVWTVSGVTYASEFGGFIPPGQASYYPANVSWPYLQGDPNTNPSYVDGAAWWWAQANNASNPGTYDAQLAACTTSNPCKWPIVGWTASPSLDTAIADWIQEIKTLSGGRLDPYSYDLSGLSLYSQASLGNGQGSLPVYHWGWIQDYADPTDWYLPMWAENGTFSYMMGTYWMATQSAYNSASCGHSGDSFANLTYWANFPNEAIPTACEGTAYNVMNDYATIAATDTNLAQRTLYYNLVSHIGNDLSLMVYEYNNVDNIDYGSWLSPTGINVNPSQGPGGVQTWYTWQYASNVFQTSFTESGLASGTSWSVTYHGVTKSSTTTTIAFPGQSNGSAPYAVAYVPGYAASPSNGTVAISGANQAISVTFTAIGTPSYLLTFAESGLVAGTNWSVTVVNVGIQSSTGLTMSFNLTAGTYAYVPGSVIGYTAPAANSTTLAAPGTTVSLTYASSSATYNVDFTEAGLPFDGAANGGFGGTPSWGITIGGITYIQDGAFGVNDTTFTEPNGTYVFAVVAPTGYTPAAASGIVVVNGADVEVMVTFAPTGSTQAVTFAETGLPTGTSWSAFVMGFGQSSTSGTITFALPAGVYNWTIATVGGWYAPVAAGNVTVDHTAVSVPVAFAQFTYAVTFFESGLPAGTSWGVNVSGTPYMATGDYLTVQLPNGTATFTAISPTGFAATPATGSLTVNAGPMSEVIIFAQKYTVTFTESGLPSGTTWTLYFNGQSHTGSGAISVDATNGSWTYAASASGYTATPSGGTVTVNGAATSVSISFAKRTTSTTTGIDSTYGLSSLAYGLIGLFVVLTIVFLVVAIAARRRPPAAPPQTWSGTTQGSSGEETQQSPPPSS